MSCSRTTTPWRRWGSNPRPFGLESSSLPLGHCAPIINIMKAINMKDNGFWCHNWRLKIFSHNYWRKQPCFDWTQAEKKFYTSNAIFRVDVNDVKSFLNPAGRLPADHFRYPQYMRRVLKTTNWLLIEILLSLTRFQQFTGFPVATL